MTAQAPDLIVNECPYLDLTGLNPYDVITGDPRTSYGWGTPYPFRHRPRPPQGSVTSMNWKGFTAEYRLTGDGHLELIGFHYSRIRFLARSLPSTDEPRGAWLAVHRISDRFTETLEGDFFLVLKERFEGKRTYLPFLDGTVVTDRDQWICERD